MRKLSLVDLTLSGDTFKKNKALPREKFRIWERLAIDDFENGVGHMARRQI